MATGKRYPFILPSVGAPSGEVWTSALGDHRPAVLLTGRDDPGAPDMGNSAAQRLARAGYTAVMLSSPADGASAVEANLAAVGQALAGGTLVPGLAPPATVVIMGYGAGEEPARAYAAAQPRAVLVTWKLAVGAGRAVVVEVEMMGQGSHAVEHSLKPDEALESLLAWLARVI